MRALINTLRFSSASPVVLELLFLSLFLSQPLKGATSREVTSFLLQETHIKQCLNVDVGVHRQKNIQKTVYSITILILCYYYYGTTTTILQYYPYLVILYIIFFHLWRWYSHSQQSWYYLSRYPILCLQTLRSRKSPGSSQEVVPSGVILIRNKIPTTFPNHFSFTVALWQAQINEITVHGHCQIFENQKR